MLNGWSKVYARKGDDELEEFVRDFYNDDSVVARVQQTATGWQAEVRDYRTLGKDFAGRILFLCTGMPRPEAAISLCDSWWADRIGAKTP